MLNKPLWKSMALSLSSLRVTLGFASAAVGRTHLVHSSPSVFPPQGCVSIGPGTPQLPHARAGSLGDEVPQGTRLTRELPLPALAHVYPELPSGLAVALEGSQPAARGSLAFSTGLG